MYVRAASVFFLYVFWALALDLDTVGLHWGTLGVNLHIFLSLSGLLWDTVGLHFGTLGNHLCILLTLSGWTLEPWATSWKNA